MPFPGSFPVEQAQIGKLDLIYCRYINYRSYCLGMIYPSYHDIALEKNWKFMLWQCLPYYEFAKFNGMDLPDIFRRVDLCTFHKDIQFQSRRIFRFFPVNCSLVITASNLLTLKMRADFLKISAKHQISHFPNTGNLSY